jgi:hypothetical protein
VINYNNERSYSGPAETDGDAQVTPYHHTRSVIGPELAVSALQGGSGVGLGASARHPRAPAIRPRQWTGTLVKLGKAMFRHLPDSGYPSDHPWSLRRREL